MMDDKLVFGKDKEQHNRWLQMVPRKLSESNLKLNWEKCKFAQAEINFMGQMIDQNGVHPDPTQVKAIINMPPPTN